MSYNPTPTQAWAEMVDGNRRFVAGTPRHPRQGVERRHELTAAQRPHAALFGCADSRLAAEIIFDEGLGDLFVIRNAGQVVSPSVLGSLEYAVAALGVPLIVVLGHDACGAVRAAIDATGEDAPVLPPQVWKQIAPIVPAVQKSMRDTRTTSATVSAELVGREHLRTTVGEILQSSELISEAVAEGRLAIVAANYRLAEGEAVADFAVGLADASA
ncbi:carbonic anhydrase [Microbacterium gorillae]|uniref:carbonic anhydrase n=1 Tax=Microbacterium gorillae TaxID=1231063 RepID=UPI00059110ED|nr:carbonic anhydrase [Microbacterium gorillae]